MTIQLSASDRTELRKRQIATRAAALLRSRGYSGLSVDDLCAALKLNKTTFYRYFPTKEQLLFELHEWTMVQIHKMAEEALSIDGSAADKLAAMVRGQIILQQSPGMGSLTIPQLNVFSPKHRRIVLAKRDEYEAIIRSLIEQGIEDGTFRPASSKMQAMLLLSMLGAVQNWYRIGGELSPEELAGEILALTFHGLLSPDAKWMPPPGKPPASRRKASARREPHDS